MNMITSADNVQIKELKALSSKKGRDEKKQFIIEGCRTVEEAVKEKAGIVRTFLSESALGSIPCRKVVSMLENAGHKPVMLSDRIFKSVSDTENPQGLLAVVKSSYYEIKDMISKTGFIIMLESIQDPGNLGTIIRTADAAGAAGVILSKGCVDLYNSKVIRSTMGSIFHIPVCFSEKLTDSISCLKEKGFRVYASHLKGSINYFELDLKLRCAFVIGNEANGISDQTAAAADALVKIPMPGKAESLNASVSAALLMYEAVRQQFK